MFYINDVKQQKEEAVTSADSRTRVKSQLLRLQPTVIVWISLNLITQLEALKYMHQDVWKRGADCLSTWFTALHNNSNEKKLVKIIRRFGLWKMNLTAEEKLNFQGMKERTRR